MAHDRYSTTHHLTPKGWSHQDERPNDALETWICTVDQPSGFSDEYRNWRCGWADRSVDRASRDKLRAEFEAELSMQASSGNGVVTSVGEPL